MKKKIKTSTVVLLSMGIFFVIFVAAMIAIYCVYQSTPDILIQCVLGVGNIEGIALAAIKITKTIKEKREEKKDETDDSDDSQEAELS